MKPKTLRRLRTLHRWAGLFFAPMIILFALSGVLQVAGVDDWDLPEWVISAYELMEDAHQDQRMRRGTALRSAATALTIVMGVALTLTTAVGMAMAWKMNPKQRRRTLLVLAAGVAVPLIVMLV